MDVSAPLPPDEVHLWYLLSDELPDSQLLLSHYDLMNQEEKDRYHRYIFPRHRHLHLMTRALVRCALSHYADVPPAAWEFVANAYGRPEIAAPPGPPQLYFNLSNTDGMVVCLIGGARDIGVDVEDTTRERTPLDIADRFFAPAEVAELRALPPHQQVSRFYDYWTLKESYIKARGLGLALPLEKFWFTIATDRSVRVTFDPSLGDDAQRWRFMLMQWTPRHRVAIALPASVGAARIIVQDGRRLLR